MLYAKIQIDACKLTITLKQHQTAVKFVVFIIANEITTFVIFFLDWFIIASDRTGTFNIPKHDKASHLPVVETWTSQSAFLSEVSLVSSLCCHEMKFLSLKHFVCHKKRSFPSHPPQFERDKQHDIRSFFSPSVNKEKKRKRTGDSPSDGSPLAQLSEGAEPVRTPEIQSSDLKADQGEDFSLQVKRFRQVSPLSCRGGKKSPLSSLCAPRRLSAGLQAPRHNQKWNCSACTFSNSGLLLRCEMCESPRNAQKGEIYTHKQLSKNLFLLMSASCFWVNLCMNLVSHCPSYGLKSSGLLRTYAVKIQTEPLFNFNSKLLRKTKQALSNTLGNHNMLKLFKTAWQLLSNILTLSQLWHIFLIYNGL